MLRVAVTASAGKSLRGRPAAACGVASFTATTVGWAAFREYTEQCSDRQVVGTRANPDGGSTNMGVPMLEFYVFHLAYRAVSGLTATATRGPNPWLRLVALIGLLFVTGLAYALLRNAHSGA